MKYGDYMMIITKEQKESRLSKELPRYFRLHKHKRSRHPSGTVVQKRDKNGIWRGLYSESIDTRLPPGLPQTHMRVWRLRSYLDGSYPVIRNKLSDYYKIDSSGRLLDSCNRVLDGKRAVDLPGELERHLNGKTKLSARIIKNHLLSGTEPKPLGWEPVLIHDKLCYVPQGVRRNSKITMVDPITGQSSVTTQIKYSTVDALGNKLVYECPLGLKVNPDGYVLLIYTKNIWECVTSDKIVLSEAMKEHYGLTMDTLTYNRIVGWLVFGELKPEKSTRIYEDGVVEVDSSLSCCFSDTYKDESSTSKYRGVSLLGNLWRAKYRHDHLGAFTTPEEAYEVYLEARRSDLGDPQTGLIVREAAGREYPRDWEDYISNGGKKTGRQL